MNRTSAMNDILREYDQLAHFQTLGAAGAGTHPLIWLAGAGMEGESDGSVWLRAVSWSPKSELIAWGS